MKRLFLLIAVAGLAFAACENDDIGYNDDDYTDNGGGGGGGNSGIDDDKVINKRGYIKFKDPLVEEVCVRKFDLNGDGKLSYQEAARVEIIEGNGLDISFFEEYTEQITSFDELQYFVNLKEVGYFAFAYCTSLTSITIPEGLQKIGDWAFTDCTSLTSITLPEGVTTIGRGAFADCTSLTTITLPEGLQTIGYCAFEYCTSLTSITLPEGLQTIESYAFYDCSSLTSITLPDGLQTIGDNAFMYCTSLTTITIPESVTEIGEYNPFASCSKLQEFKGRYSADGGRALIKDNTFIAFANACGTTEYTIPNGVTIIGNYAFYYCDSLTSITLPEGLQTIGTLAFHNCYNLTSITLPEGLQTIESYAFYVCTSLTTITIPESVTEIGDNPFVECSKLQEFKGKYSADGGRALIKDNTFIAFAHACGTTEYTIPNNVTIIGYDAFAYCRSLTSVTLPQGLQTIGDRAFASCKNLTTITISESVTEIGSQAFGYSGIKKLYCKPTTPPTISGSNLFPGSGIAGRTIYVPRASVEAYKSAKGWSEYASAIVGYNF